MSADFVAYVRDLEEAADRLEHSLRELLRLLPSSTPAVDRANLAVLRYNDLKVSTASSYAPDADVINF